MEEQQKKQYPSWRYHASGASRLIESPDDEEEGWTQSPADHEKPEPAIPAHNPKKK